jgi:hypothetical protein
MLVDQQANKEGLLLLQTRISQIAMEQMEIRLAASFKCRINAMRKPCVTIKV